ncbi:MAG: glycosyltransferase, partial [Candidatus Nealsonbacteria bacterium]|nr:glycosyltransferase [Candidatus Nealsonbacteria bacterium]
MLKVLIPALHYPPVIGGLEVWIENIAERVGDENTQVFLVTGRVEGEPEEETRGGAKIIRTSLFPLKDLSYSSFFYIATALPFIFFRCLALIRKEKIDLCHCHGFLGGFLGLLLKAFTNTPYLITIQSADFDIYHPKAGGITTYIHDSLEKKIFQEAAKRHTVSTFLQEFYESRGIEDSILIPNGVELDKFKPLADRQKARKELGFDVQHLFICVSRLEHKNGTH